MQTLSRWAAWVAAGVILLFASYLLLNDLHVGPLAQYDEGTYAHIVAESFERGDFITFTWNGELFFDKPPLYFWLAGIATVLTDDPILGIRLPAAIGGILLVATVMYLVFAVYRNPWAAVFAGALLVSNRLFIEGARESRLDILVGLFILLALFGFWRALRGEEKWYLLFGAATALAVLSKSAIAVFAPISALFLVLMVWNFSFLRNRYFWWSVLLGAVIVLPWHLIEWWRHGNAFWQSYLGFNVFERFERNLFNDPNLQADYIARLKDFAEPFYRVSWAALLLLPLSGYCMPKYNRGLLVASGGAALMMLGLFMSAETRAITYLLPVYPLMAVFVGLTVASLWRRAKLK